MDRALSGATISCRVDLRAMAMKGCSAFPKSPASQEPHHQIVLCHIQDTRYGVLPLCRGSDGVFYSPTQLGNDTFGCVSGQRKIRFCLCLVDY